MPSALPPNQVRGFTINFGGLAKAIITKVGVSQSFDPISVDEADRPDQKIFDAIWDTGATGTVITEKVVQECSLQPIGMARVCGVNGVFTTSRYLINIALPNKVGIAELSVTEGRINDADILIGMDIMSKGDLAISNYSGKTIFSFRIPSFGDVDLGKDQEAQPPSPQQTPVRSDKVGRNSPCPCGSGKKYKKCCGQNK